MAKCTYNEIKIAGVVIPLTAEVSYWPTHKVQWNIEWETDAGYFLISVKNNVSFNQYAQIMDAIQKDFEQQWLDAQEKTVR